MTNEKENLNKSTSGLRGIGVAAIIFFILLAVYLLFSPKGQEPDKGLEEWESLNFGLALQPTDALLMIAFEKDFFLDEKLRVNIEAYPSGKRALREGLFSGKVDLASSADAPVAFAGLNGRDFKIFATIYNASNINRIIACRDKGISVPSQLKGKRVATQKSSAVHFFLHLFLKNEGLLEKEMELSFMKAEELPEALVSGRIDAFSMREPYIGKAKQKLGEGVVIFSAPGLYNQVEVLVASSEFLRRKPKVIDHFIKVLLRAEEFAKNNQEEAILITAKWLGVDKSKIEQIWPTVEFKISMDQSLLLTLEEQVRWAINKGYVKTDSVPNYLEHIYIKSLKRIKPEAVSIRGKL